MVSTTLTASSHFETFTDVPGETLVQLVDEHEHVAVLFYSSLDKNTKKVIAMVVVILWWWSCGHAFFEGSINSTDKSEWWFVGPMQVLSEMGEMETGDLDVEIVR